MGTDINGWVEVSPSFRDASSPYLSDRRWDAVVKIGSIIQRNYNAFGCLFGVMNLVNFAPLAAERGMPDDVSEEAEAAYLEATEEPASAFSPSWITWAELRAADWDARAATAVRGRGQPTRKEALGSVDWLLLFEIMGALAKQYGDDRVRLVVWFDR